MARRASDPNARVVAAGESAGQAYLRALVAYIPSEATALYLFLLGVLVPAEGTSADQVHTVRVAIFIISVVFAWLFVLHGFKPLADDSRNRKALKLGMLLAIAAVAFGAYSMATPGGPWDGQWSGIEITQIGAGLAAIISLGLPVIVRPLGLEAPPKQSQAIAFPQPADQTLATAKVTLGAAATSELPIAYTASGTCNVVGSEASFTVVGSCTVTAAQEGNEVFAPATPVQRTFRIT